MLAYLAMQGSGYDVVVRQQVGLVIWAVVAIGFALGMLPRAQPDRAVVVPLSCAAGLLAWMLLSLLWTGSEERTTAEIARLLTYLALMAFVVVSLNRFTFRAAAAGLSATALGIAGIAVASRLDPSAFQGANDVLHVFRTDRLSYPLQYWNAIGAWGAMAVAIGLAWSAHARFAVTRALALAAVPVAGLAVYLSYSRGGVIASGVAVLAVLVLSQNRWTCFIHVLAATVGTAVAVLIARGQPQIADATGGAGAGAVTAALLGAAAICVGAVVLTTMVKADRARLHRTTANWAVPGLVCVLLAAVLLAGHGPISQAWSDFKTQDKPTAGADPAARLTGAGGNRNNLWSSAIDAFEAHPAGGIGPGTFEFWHERNGDDAEYVRDAHSLYLEQLAELGLPGFVLLVGFLGGLLVAALVARRALSDPGDVGASVAMCSAFVVFLVSAGVDWMWEQTAVGALALGGVAVAISARSKRIRRPVRRGVIVRPGLRPAIVAVALLAAVVEIPGLVATQRLRASEAAVRDGDLASARVLAQDAAAAEPWAATPHQQLASVQLLQGQLSSARREIRLARTKEPENWRHPLVQVQVDAEVGDRAAAQSAFLKGRELAPRLAFYGYGSEYALLAFSRRDLVRLYYREHPNAARNGG